MCSITGWSQSAELGDIHGIDFRNFRYYPSGLNEEGARKRAVKVVNGSYTKNDADGEVTFKVNDVFYGDLNGDGKDEAVVLTVCNTGGSLWADDGFLYTMRNGKPALLTNIQGGDRANGGIRGVRIEDGMLKVEQLGSSLSGRAIGADFIDTTTYRLSGSRLLRVGRPVRRSFRGENRAKRIQFERGASSATLAGTASGADFYVLGARENQTLTVRISSPQNNARFELITDDFTMAYRVTEWSGKLEYRGDYHLVVVSNNGSADYKLEVSVR
jgi:hypothetical protein